ncbi:hypothetical protein T484DRAFT_1800009 [Baffinella frigidus]|nr:hypothetical protein T484DRAFT_1800009 [Cryptophyta sp. CCMP2293]
MPAVPATLAFVAICFLDSTSKYLSELLAVRYRRTLTGFIHDRYADAESQFIHDRYTDAESQVTATP